MLLIFNGLIGTEEFIDTLTFLRILLLLNYVVLEVEEFIVWAFFDWYKLLNWPLIIFNGLLGILIFLHLLGLHLTRLTWDVETHILVAHIVVRVERNVVQTVWWLLSFPQTRFHALGTHHKLLGLIQFGLVDAWDLGALVYFHCGVQILMVLGLLVWNGSGCSFSSGAVNWRLLLLIFGIWLVLGSHR